MHKNRSYLVQEHFFDFNVHLFLSAINLYENSLGMLSYKILFFQEKRLKITSKNIYLK